MTRKEAIKMAGIKKVEEVENENVDFTCAITDGTEWHGFDGFSATVDLDDNKYGDFLVMYIFIDRRIVANVEQLDELDWEHHIKTAEFEIE